MLMPMLWNGNSGLTDWTDPFDAMDRALSSFWGDSLETTKSMKTDVIEENGNYRLEAELPGFQKEDIHVDMKNGNLTISAAHEENKDEKDGNGRYIRRERRYASYQRSFRVGENLQPEDIEAKYENGVLTLVIPKKERLPQQEEVKRIEVK